MNEKPEELQKIKSGRKKKQQTSRYYQTPLNPYRKIYYRLMKYMLDIGLIHGLCFTPQLRRSLKQHNKSWQIDWKQNDEGWQYNQQLHRIRDDDTLMKRLEIITKTLKTRCNGIKNRNKLISQNGLYKLQSLSKWKLEDIIDLVIRSGEMVDSQCRLQMYTMNVMILQIIFIIDRKNNNKQQQCKQQQGYAQNFLKESKFFSRRFTTLKKKNWIEIKKCKSYQIQILFIKFCKILKKYYKSILYDFQLWNLYNMGMKQLFNQEEHNTYGKIQGNQLKLQQQQSQ